jgi:hypothetical protein
MRPLPALLVAPLGPAVLPAWFAAQKGLSPLAVYGGVCAAFWLLQVVVGVPAWLLLRRRRQPAWLYAALGFVAVAAPIGAWATFVGPGSSGQSTILAAYLGLLGGLTAVIYWLLARPDRAPVAGPRL